MPLSKPSGFPHPYFSRATVPSRKWKKYSRQRKGNSLAKSPVHCVISSKRSKSTVNDFLDVPLTDGHETDAEVPSFDRLLRCLRKFTKALFSSKNAAKKRFNASPLWYPYLIRKSLTVPETKCQPFQPFCNRPLKNLYHVSMLAYKHISISAYWHTEFETGSPRLTGRGTVFLKLFERTVVYPMPAFLYIGIPI